MPIAFQSAASDIPEWLKEYYAKLLARSEVLATEFDRGPVESEEAYRERAKGFKYPGPRLAEPTQDIKDARDLGKIIGAHKPYFDRAEKGIEGARKPFYEAAQDYMNPYTKFVIDEFSRHAIRNFNEDILPSIANQFVSLGQHGSSRQRDAVRKATNDFTQNLSSKLDSMLSQGYESSARMFNADQERRLHSAQADAELGRINQASHFADVDSLMRQGIQEQAQKQAQMDIDYQDYLMELNRPRNLLTQHAAIVHGMPYQGESITASYHPNPQTQSHLNPAGYLSNITGQMLPHFLPKRARGGSIKKRRYRIGPHLMNIRRKK